MPERTWTPLALIAWTQGYFARAGVDAPRLTAEILLAHALGCDRVRLYLDFDKPIGEVELVRYRGLVKRRAEGEPTAYLTGSKEFYGRSFSVDPRVLIPRPETELLVEAALSTLPAGATVIDLCTGTGCVAITVALERPAARVFGTDLSTTALEVARANAARLGARVEWAEGDLFGPLDPALRFDLILANPPYVPTTELSTLSREVRREPVAALDGGEDGLAIIRRLVPEAARRLAPEGTLLVEIHETHAEEVPRLCREAGLPSALHRDLAGLPRFVVANAPAGRAAPGAERMGTGPVTR